MISNARSVKGGRTEWIYSNQSEIEVHLKQAQATISTTQGGISTSEAGISTFYSNVNIGTGLTLTNSAALNVVTN